MRKTKEENEKKTSKIKEEKVSASIEKKARAPRKTVAKTTKNVKTSASTNSVSPVIAEYYDLPYRYNQTVIKILAQTPHSLFIYWDISDQDRQEMINKYGEKFFYETKPVLFVHNKTLNSNFEIEVDDFTNSWYMHTPTSNCVFEIELGRRLVTPDDSIHLENNVMHITKSNELESPNDHNLRNELSVVYFKNLKTNELEKRDVSNYNINNVYNLINIYDEENSFEKNPSSGFRIS